MSKQILHVLLIVCLIPRCMEAAGQVHEQRPDALSPAVPETLSAAVPETLSPTVIDAMQRATAFYHLQVSVHGGYVYEYSPDLKVRTGEGRASPTEIWVQPPGTPTVGGAYLRAYAATRDLRYLTAAHDAGRALIHGQLKSGGWTASIEFDPDGRNADVYRNGKGRTKGRNYSTLDDDKSQAAIRFLMSLDQTLEFRDETVHESVKVALDALLAAQFPNGGFPQGWKGPSVEKPIRKAGYPDFDWRTENRVKDYWDLYTLNDGLAGTVAETLILAHEIYRDERYLRSLAKLGEFLIIAQMPEPQPVWAQQYSDDMHPAWARKFEPPAVASTESLDVMKTLILIYEKTGDRQFLEPIPAAIGWFERSELPRGGFARFYELKTNRPLYFVEESYELTYDDSRLPTHYSFRNGIRIDGLKSEFQEVSDRGHRHKGKPNFDALSRDVARIVDSLDSQGRWITDPNGLPIDPIDVASVPVDQQRIMSRVFSRNMERLSEYLIAVRGVE